MVPYRAPYRAIRCAIRYLVAPPCCATRSAMRYLVAPTCCISVTPNRSIFKMKVKASTAIQQCCSTLEGLRMQPLKKVSRKQQQKRLKMAEHILRSLLQDGEVEVRMTHRGVVHLRGGCASVKDGSNATVEEKEALRFVKLVSGMRLSIRQMYRLPRACRKKDSDAARQQHTPYWCTTRAVASETGAPRASASNKLAEIFNHQISLSQAAKHLRPMARTSLWCCQLMPPLYGKHQQLGVTFLSTVGNNQVMQGPLTYGQFGGPCGGVMTHISC